MSYLSKTYTKKFSPKRDELKKEMKYTKKKTKKLRKWNYQDLREWYSQPEIEIIEDIGCCLHFAGAK